MSKRINWDRHTETLTLFGKYKLDMDLLYWSGMFIFAVFFALAALGVALGIQGLTVPATIFVVIALVGFAVIIGSVAVILIRAWVRMSRSRRK